MSWTKTIDFFIFKSTHNKYTVYIKTYILQWSKRFTPLGLSYQTTPPIFIDTLRELWKTLLHFLGFQDHTCDGVADLYCMNQTDVDIKICVTKAQQVIFHFL